MRTFESGATRDSDDTKIDYWGFLSPFVLRRFGEYMNKHRKQADGVLRASDNWKKGIPQEAYQKSLARHFMQFFEELEVGANLDAEESACAMLFNIQGWLHEATKDRAGEEAESLEAFLAPLRGSGKSEVVCLPAEPEWRDWEATNDTVRMPVLPNTLVQVELANGTKSPDWMRASVYVWHRRGAASIIKYRVKPEAPDTEDGKMLKEESGAEWDN